MIASLVSKIKQKRITREDIAIIVIHSTFHKTISVYHVKLFGRMRILSFCFHKMQKILIIYTLTIVTMICQLGRLKDSVKMCGMVLVIITLLPLI